MELNLNKCDCSLCEFKTIAFEDLNTNEMISLCGYKTEKNYKKGEVIVCKGDEITDFLYLKSGLVKLYKAGKDGKDQIISIAKPFDFVSLVSIFSDANYNFSISALEDSTVCSVDLPFIKNLISSNGKFALNIMSKMSRNFDKIIDGALNLQTKHLRGRIAHILLFFSNEIYKCGEFEIPLSRKEIAQLIDMTTENVIRILSEFRTDKLIEIHGKNTVILDDKKLQSIAEHG
ncbi:MAG: hypothetical protein A2033_05395 [Bacteroidetes bacterium GWA2_31_9]|nr:MAG: hypothetical protein A2033_05395 [Bacteroidetes bacterium GWA2_31_9]